MTSNGPPADRRLSR